MQTENEKAVRDPIAEAIDLLEKSAAPFDKACMLLRAALKTQSNTDGLVMSGWIEFSGGECPVPPGTYVEVKQRRGNTTTARLAESISWKWYKWYKEPWNKDLDIVAYRIVGYTEAALEKSRQVSNTPQDGPEGWPEAGSVVAFYGPYSDYEDGRHETVAKVLAYSAGNVFAVFQIDDCHPFHYPVENCELNRVVSRSAPPQQQEQSGEVVTPYSLQTVVSFLCGEGPMDGVWFGEAHPHERDKYWWRKYLRAATSPATPTAAASQESASGQEAVAYQALIYGKWQEVKKEEYESIKALIARKEEVPGITDVRSLYLAPPTSTAIAAMAIKQAAEVVKCYASIRKQDQAVAEVMALLPANAEAELEALMMKVAEAVDCDPLSDRLTIVRRVLDGEGE